MRSASCCRRTAQALVIIAGSSPPSLSDWRLTAGKVWLIERVLLLAEQGRLRVAKDCTGAADLKGEMAAFTALPTRRGVRLEAARDAHDDLVLALALAVSACG
jgi:hypothetical protein